MRKKKYKAEWNDKTVITADRWFASSKICSCCGYVNKSLLLREKEWVCPDCGTRHLRDRNAAVNLKNYGERIRVASPEFKPAENLQLSGNVLNGFGETGNANREVCEDNAVA